MRIEQIEPDKQFETSALQLMLKSRRIAQHLINDSRVFTTKIEDESLSFAAMLVGSKTMSSHNAKQLKTDRVEQSLPKNTSAKEEISSTAVDTFVRSLWPHAEQAARRLNLDPKILLAQTALETGWGRYVIRASDGSSSNNLFNMKAKSGFEHQSVEVKTSEYLGNGLMKIKAAFKKYASIQNSFDDYVALIKNNKRYALALENSTNPASYLLELQRAGYATDPAYAAKILSIYHGDELQQALSRVI